MDCDVMPRDKFVYVVERGFTGLSHCFLSAHASTVCSFRVLGSQDMFWKEKQTLSFIPIDIFSFDLLFIILTFLMCYSSPP